MTLLDQFGVSIPAADIARLREEISPPSAAHARPPFAGHLAFGLNPERLGGILRAADAGNSQAWMVLAEEIEELFPHYLALLSKRRRQVTQLPITVQAADESNPDYVRHAEFVRDWLRTGVLQRALYDITDALGKGFSVSEIIWETKPGACRPKEISYRPPRFFEISWQDGATVWLRTETGFVDLAPHKFLLHTHRTKSGLVVRSGLTRQVAFLFLYATYTGKDWALFTQAYGMPIRVGRYGPEASETDKRVLWRAVSSIAGDVAAIIPKSMEMEFVKDTDRNAGQELYLKRLDWLNREVSKLVLGGTAGTEAINGGHAVGQEHREAENDVEQFDAFLLQTSVDRQIIQPMIAFTFGPQEQYPTLQMGRPDEIPLQNLIAGIADLGPLGLRVKKSEVLARLQLTPPEPEDEVIGGVAPAPVDKPELPRLQVTPRVTAQSEQPAPGFLGRLITRHAEAPPELVEALTQRLAEEADGAMAGLTDAIRAEFEAAHSMRDLVHRLDRLKLDPAQFAEAMTRGLALAQLVGQAALVEELRTRH